MFMLKYSKSVYESKMGIVEGYLEQLKGCLTTMENLKDEMFQFWNDEHAQKAAGNLVTEIRQVKNAITRTEDWINLYKSVITHMEQSNDAIDQLAEDAQSALDSLGV